MHLVASLDCSHWELLHGAQVKCLTLEKFDLRDKHVNLKSCILACLYCDVLAFSDYLDIALIHVEEIEAYTLVDLVRVADLDRLIRVVLVDPLAALFALGGFCGSFRTSSWLGWRSFRRSRLLLFFRRWC